MKNTDVSQTLAPIAQAPDGLWQSLRFVFVDIDDTLTTEGRLEADAYAMMERLSGNGLAVIPVTGRPAGWCDMIARFWPVEAVVGENGAFYFHYDHEARRMTRIYAQTAAEREQNRTKLAGIRDTVLSTIPGAAVAADQRYREADLAIDFCEDVTPLPDGEVDRIVDIFHEAGATAKVSSIHVNGWFGNFDKLSMTRKIMLHEFGVNIADTEVRGACAFIGDSPNDAPMFAYFQNSVGVANVADMAARCDALPRWITEAASGAGFCEFAAHVLAARGPGDVCRKSAR